MKRSAKILAMLLVLTMLLGIIPMAVAADETNNEVATYATTPEVSLGRTNLDGYWVEKGAPNSSVNGTSYSASYTQRIGEQDNYQHLPILGNASVWYSPVAYKIPTTGSVKVSNDGIIDDLSFSMEPYYGTPSDFRDSPCLQFNFKAVAAGTTKVTLTYYYNFNVTGYTSWYKATTTLNITVLDEQIQKPDKPSESDLNNFYNYVNKTSTSTGAVYMWCAASLYDHGAWFNYLSDVPGAYTLGEVVANDGSSNMSAINYPWTCTMTVDTTKYLEAYNKELGAKCGTHYLEDGESETKTVTWYYRAGLNKWQYISSNAPIYIDITHKAPAASTYSVTYTDGVEGEEVFADQVYTVNAGEATPAFDGKTTRDGYVFLGWEPAVAETVTADATYTAKWEEALTEVKLTTKTNEGTLLFLGDTVSVTATANTAAAITMDVKSYKDGSEIPNLKLVDTKVSEDGKSTTFTYEVVNVKNGFAHVGFTATATKGSQTAVKSEQLKRGLNFRNRIHVTIKDTQGKVIGDATEVKLNHKYPKWNKSPELKFDANKGEYVMKNAWDLSNQEFVSVSFTLGGETYVTDKTKDGHDLFTVVRAGNEEIYVEYVVVAPIKVTVNVNGVLYTEQSYKGSNGAELNYTELYYSVLDMIKESGKMATISITVDGTAGMKAVFGTNNSVVIDVTTN